VHLSKEFLLKPQTQKHSPIAKHLLNYIAVHSDASVDSKGCPERSGKWEETGRGDPVPQIVPWITASNSTGAQHIQTSEVSTAIIYDHPRFVDAEADQTQVGCYYTPGAFLDPSVFTPSPMLLPPPSPQSEYERENYHIIPSFSEAHQPVPLERHSTYSELAPHLAFMEKFQQEQELGQVVDVPTRKLSQADRSPKARNHRQSTFPSPTKRSGRPERRSGSAKFLGQVGEDPSTTSLRSGRMRFTSLPLSDRAPIQELNSDAPLEVSLPNASSASSKKSSIACIFCRERKIGCDRGVAGRMDIPCTPCTRRSFDCVLVRKTPKVNQPTSRRS